MRAFSTLLFAFLLSFPLAVSAQHSVAREWNEMLLMGIRGDFARPTVHARNLFHTSVAMYDAWAVYDTIADTYLLGKTVDGFTCPFDGVPAPADVEAAQEEAISYAMYRLLKHRFQFSPSVTELFTEIESFMASLGYDESNTSTDYTTGDPAALGNYIAECIINFGLQDGSNEQFGYLNLYYEPVNPPLVMALPGNPDMQDYNRWQPLTLDVFIDQSGNVIPFNTPDFLGPEWGQVSPFSLTEDDLTVYERDGFEYYVYHDPGMPPHLDTTTLGGLSEEYKWNFSVVAVWSGHLEASDDDLIDISPASVGNIQDYPQAIEELPGFYNLLEGGDPGTGYDLNPKTGEPYEPQMVSRGDYARVLAEYWADGPDSETPPGHWFTILNYVNDHPEFEKRFRGQGEILDDLEWDVKAYFALGGAMHDAAVASWGIKGWYDYPRPVSAIRAMAEFGQSSDPALPSFHPGGIHLVPEHIELVEIGDTLAGDSNQHVGKIKIYGWRGPNYITDPATDAAGVGWILAENWWPYQRPSFVSPPFAGYISGHSTFSRAAAEVMTAISGDPFFPGGKSEFLCPQNEFLVFEEGPSQDILLEWATYRDASDQTSLSRIWGGIHPPADDIPGRLIGIEIGVDAINLAETYFYQDADQDGYFNNVDCDDNNATVFPGAMEICDGLDNNCDGEVDEGIQYAVFYLDNDGDGYGTLADSTEVCPGTVPTGFADNTLDCDDTNDAINPMMSEVCDGIDNNCSGAVDEGLQVFTYFVDSDNDGFGDALSALDTCESTLPAGYVVDSTDCDDTNPNINPGMMEVYDSLDNDCNGLVDDGVTSARESQQKAAKLFPNPTYQSIQIEYEFSGLLLVKVIHADGRLVKKAKLDFSNGVATLDLREVQGGVYWLETSDENSNRHFLERIIKL